MDADHLKETSSAKDAKKKREKAAFRALATEAPSAEDVFFRRVVFFVPRLDVVLYMATRGEGIETRCD